MTEQPLVVRVDSRSYAVTVTGRAAALALLVAVEALRINRTHCGSLTVHWDGDSLRPEWRESGQRLTLADVMSEPYIEPLSSQPTSDALDSRSSAPHQ